MTLLLEKSVEALREINVCNRHYEWNQIWPPLDNASGHYYLRNFLADCHYFGVYYKVFEGTQSIGEVFCENKQRVNQVTAIFNQM